MGDSENRNVNCFIYNGGEKISLYLHAAVEKSGRLNFDEYCIDVYYVTVNGGGLQVMNVSSFLIFLQVLKSPNLKSFESFRKEADFLGNASLFPGQQPRFQPWKKNSCSQPADSFWASNLAGSPCILDTGGTQLLLSTESSGRIMCVLGYLCMNKQTADRLIDG